MFFQRKPILVGTDALLMQILAAAPNIVITVTTKNKIIQHLLVKTLARWTSDAQRVLLLLIFFAQHRQQCYQAVPQLNVWLY